jgi:hypothetical protein
MKYTIFGLQQEELIKNKLSLDEALVIERLIWLSGIYEEQWISGEPFKWISYSKIKDEIPIVASSDAKLKRIMSKLESLGIISRAFKRANNKTKVFFRFGEKIKTLTGQNQTVTANRSEMTGMANRSEMTGDSSGKKSSGMGKFSPPSLDEVRQYIKEKGLNVNADVFYKTYSNSDWRDRNNRKIANWKLTANTWSNREDGPVKGKKKDDDGLIDYTGRPVHGI